MNTWIDRPFSGAQQMMDDDRKMAETLPEGERHFCLYEWGDRGVTYGFKQDLPGDLGEGSALCIDGGRRATGGGIVFHNPGDLVIACAAPLHDGNFPNPLHQKMATIRDLFQRTFQVLNIDLNPRPCSKDDSDPNWKQFCASYPNPYELFYQDSKILALTLRRFKTSILIQGILHLHDNHRTFNDVAQYAPYFSAGLPDKHRPGIHEIRDTLKQEIQKHFV